MKTFNSNKDLNHCASLKRTNAYKEGYYSNQWQPRTGSGHDKIFICFFQPICRFIWPHIFFGHDSKQFNSTWPNVYVSRKRYKSFFLDIFIGLQISSYRLSLSPYYIQKHWMGLFKSRIISTHVDSNTLSIVVDWKQFP